MYLLAVNATYLTEGLAHIDLLERAVRLVSGKLVGEHSYRQN